MFGWISFYNQHGLPRNGPWQPRKIIEKEVKGFEIKNSVIINYPLELNVF